MIPASYLFKDVFHQAFYEPDISEAVERHRQTHRGRRLFARLWHWRGQAAPAQDADCGRRQPEPGRG